MDKIRLTIILTLFAALCGTAYGQVTIGSGNKPVNGALLDIKKNDDNNGGVTASQGMLLPRVNLVNLTPTIPSELATSIGSSGTWDLKAHIGLTVYNIGNCPGVYVWTGSEWIKLGEPCAQALAPSAPLGTNVFFCAPSIATISATAGTGETVDFYDQATGGNKIAEGTTETTTYTTPATLTEKTTFFAEARNITTNVVSATRTEVTAYPNNDLSLIKTTETSANSDRADWLTAWGDKVVRHAAKSNTYEEFVSADFGSAGRWMTTNLSAWDYDDKVSHKVGRSLIGPEMNTAGSAALAAWCYPNVNGTNGKSDSEYIKNPLIGYLYTWDAATAGKGGTTGTEGSGDAGQSIEKVQGICPNGWHMPSKEEWEGLWYEILTNTPKYANIDAPIVVSPNPPGDIRPYPMVTPCLRVYSSPEINQYGISKRLDEGGTFMPQAGWVTGGSQNAWNRVLTYWSASSGNVGNNAWSLEQSTWAGANALHTAVEPRSGLYSVRCKKDETSPAPAPAAPTGTNDFFFCLPSGTPNLSASVGTGETVDWYDAATGGTKLSEVTPYIPASPITAKTIYYAEARNTTTGAVSATRTAVTAAPYDDLSLITTTATNAQTSSLTDIWDDKVVLHEAKPGVYDSFISAKFGTAGRWMTTNLSAKDYDSNVKSVAIRQLDGPRISSNGNYDEAYWCYSNNGDATIDVYPERPFAGLLYTWDAATASKGQSNGLFWNGNEGNKPHDAIQGVCPDGWHLPSDYEWTELENEIILHTRKYSTATSDIGSTGLLDGNQTQTFGHHLPMLSMCRLRPTYPNIGSSLPLQEGGFNAKMAGMTGTGSTTNNFYDFEAIYWTSSFGKAYADRSAWLRRISVDPFGTQGVLRIADLRNNMRSVRCKKDE
ncbi:FISUMP domain-containing protein [Dysgonomonas sp.]